MCQLNNRNFYATMKYQNTFTYILIHTSICTHEQYEYSTLDE